MEDVVVERIVVKRKAQIRITDSVELALKLGEGVLLLDVLNSEVALANLRPQILGAEND